MLSLSCFIFNDTITDLGAYILLRELFVCFATKKLVKALVFSMCCFFSAVQAQECKTETITYYGGSEAKCTQTFRTWQLANGVCADKWTEHVITEFVPETTKKSVFISEKKIIENNSCINNQLKPLGDVLENLSCEVKSLPISRTVKRSTGQCAPFDEQGCWMEDRDPTISYGNTTVSCRKIFRTWMVANGKCVDNFSEHTITQFVPAQSSNTRTISDKKIVAGNICSNNTLRQLGDVLVDMSCTAGLPISKVLPNQVKVCPGVSSPP